MRIVLLSLSLALPLAAAAQRLAETLPPITYHVGLQKAPLYHGSSEVGRRPSLFLPSQAEAIVVGKFSPELVVVRHQGFLYLTPVQALSDYDPGDAAPPPVDAHTQLITYEGVVQVPGVSQADLYARAAAWVAKAYPSANAVVERSDQAAGQLVIQGMEPAVVRSAYAGVLRASYAGVVRHTLTIYVKDGRYKYILSNLRHDAAGTPNLQSGGPLEQDHANLFGYAGLGSKKPWTDLKVEAFRNVRALLDSLQLALTLQKVTKAKDPSEF